MAIQLSKNGNAVKFDFDDNSHYLNDGTIEVPVNSLTLVTDESDMFTFKKAASDDIFISGLYEEIGMSKSELIAWYKDNMVGSTGGGGGVTPEEVQDMIDESVSGLSDDISTVSGAVDSNHNAITAVVGDVQTLSGDVANKADTTAVTASINAAVSGKMDTSAFNTYSASTDARISEDEEVTSAALNELNDALDDKADTSAVTESINAAVSGKADTSAVTASITAAVSGKQDTLVSGTNIKTINNESLLGSGNIDIQGGGGKAISAGTNISVTTGATADTINCTLPISVTMDNANSVKIGNGNCNSYANNCIVVGDSVNTNFKNCICVGATLTAGAVNSQVFGDRNGSRNECEHTTGRLNISNKANNNFGDSGNTLFSVGNGYVKYPINGYHNAFEIRQNGDIYIADTNDTTYQNYYEKPMIKLQDALGGGGLPESAFTAYTAATDARLAEDEEVTAAALNALDETKADASDLGGLKLVQLTQAQYEALTVKDASTLYLITSSN